MRAAGIQVAEHARIERRLPEASRPSPVLLYLVTEDWYFMSHRLPMALAAQRAGYEVHVAARVSAHGAAIESHGFRLHPLDWKRGSTNPFDVLSILRQVRGVYARLRPDLVHHVALQPAVIGALASVGMPVRRLHALAGLGFAFTSTTAKARVIGWALRQLMRTLFRRDAILVQNPDDRAAVFALGIPADHISLVPGSGVDTDVLVPLPEPEGPLTVGFVGRLLDDKGVRPLIAAHGLLRERGLALRLIMAGTPDPANPASIPETEIEAWRALPGVELPGFIADIRKVWGEAHIAVLPSRREGLPKSLLEAAACGRPIVATDVPGCREIARPDLNAVLVPPDNAPALADAIARLATDPALRQRLGAAGRRMVESEFSSERIGRAIVALYETLIERYDGGRGRP